MKKTVISRSERQGRERLSEYNEQQRQGILLVRRHLRSLPPRLRADIGEMIAPYLDFRERTARFQATCLAGLCSRACFADGTSACCGREGILTFFADMAVNAYLCGDGETEALLEALDGDRGGPNCVYLGEGGCRWRLKPVTCEMFLCDRARKELDRLGESVKEEWEGLRKEEKRFTLPVQPVLFDDLERLFMERGCDSPLMYCHRSPGLVRLKERHGVGRPPQGPAAPPPAGPSSG